MVQINNNINEHVVETNMNKTFLQRELKIHNGR